MAELEVKKQVVAEQAPVANSSEKQQELLSAFGGFNAVRGFMPDADNLNPTKKAVKELFGKKEKLIIEE